MGTRVLNNTTALLFFHVIKRVEDSDTGHERDSKHTPAVLKAMIPEGWTECILVFLFEDTEGMGSVVALTDGRSDFHALVICAGEALQRDALFVFVLTSFTTFSSLMLSRALDRGVVWDMETLLRGRAVQGIN